MKSNFSLCKTCVSYWSWDIFIRLKDRELNHVLLNTFTKNGSEIFKMAALNRKWRRQNDYLCFHTWEQRDSNSYTYVFGVGNTNDTCIYNVRLNWEEIKIAKSKMAAFTHEICSQTS